MSSTLKLVDVTKLPELNPKTSPMPQLGSLTNSKGKTVLLSNHASYETVILLEFLPNGELRGNHYHQHKQELLYIIEGKLTGYFWLPEDTTTLQKFTFTPGELITVPANIAHAYQAVEKTLVLELSTTRFDPADTCYQGIAIA
ncbi:MAG: hypothetical protein K0S11_839 [Gammaproteobacteria bacterium]|jgi:quercetin dioxygenase-like cupin family protein|nr:hypothetical protein [Gammaproteobacteria bacterium]